MSEKRISQRDARHRFSEVVRDAERGDVTIVTRRGVDTVVVMSVQRYRTLVGSGVSAGRSVLDTLAGGPAMDALPLARQDDTGRQIDLET